MQPLRIGLNIFPSDLFSFFLFFLILRKLRCSKETHLKFYLYLNFLFFNIIF